MLKRLIKYIKNKLRFWLGITGIEYALDCYMYNNDRTVDELKESVDMLKMNSRGNSAKNI